VENDTDAHIGADAIELYDHKDLIMLLRDTVKGLIMKPMLVYRATTFRKHGQDKHLLLICYKSNKSLGDRLSVPELFP
jgi:hypothetical protein